VQLFEGRDYTTSKVFVEVFEGFIDDSFTKTGAVIANVLRCCLPTSSASFGSVVCACVGHPVPSSSSHWRQSRKTSAGSQSSWSESRRSSSRALHKECRVRRSDHPLLGAGSQAPNSRNSRQPPRPDIADFCNKISQQATSSGSKPADGATPAKRRRCAG
jgi:hypothetical protein